jgi:hypothetical protein
MKWVKSDPDWTTFFKNATVSLTCIGANSVGISWTMEVISWGNHGIWVKRPWTTRSLRRGSVCVPRNMSVINLHWSKILWHITEIGVFQWGFHGFWVKHPWSFHGFMWDQVDKKTSSYSLGESESTLNFWIRYWQPMTLLQSNKAYPIRTVITPCALIIWQDMLCRSWLFRVFL